MSPLIILYSMRITIVSHTVGCMYLSNVHYVRLKSLFICISAQLFFGRKYSLLHRKCCLRLAYIILSHLWSFDVRYIHTYIHHYLFIYINMRVRVGKYLRIVIFYYSEPKMHIYFYCKVSSWPYTTLPFLVKKIDICLVDFE